jgi:uncharacterized protein (TIGR03437 family)
MSYANRLGYCAPIAVAIGSSLSLGAFQSGLRRRAIKATLLLCLITVPGIAQTVTTTTIESSVDITPRPLAADPAGNIYFSEQVAHRVRVLKPTASPVPAPTITQVVSAASFQAPIEAGSWVMIQGTGLANDTRLWRASDFNGNNLPTQLDGVSVTIDGIPAYVEYISPTQINVQAPSDSTTGAVPVVVTNNGQVSAAFTAQLQSAAPAFFMSPTYNVYASVIPGYTAVTSTAPAMPGDLAVLWGTGFGPTNPHTPAGTIVTGAPATATFPVVTVGGMTVPVISSVMTPGTVGLYQITIRLPDNVPTGTPAVLASIDGAQTQHRVTLFVAPGAAASTVTVQSSLTALTLGQSVTFTATISPSAAAGKVTFSDGVNILGVGQLANGQATLRTSLLTAGAHSIVALYGESESAPISIDVRALPASGFQPVRTATNFSATETIAVADFNGDGIPDLAVGQMVPIEMVGAEINTLAILLGNGDGTFRIASQPPGFGDYVVVTGDFNGDGITDLATPGGVYLGNGDGTFQDAIPLNLDFDGSLASLAVGDFNGDGKADLAWSGVANGTNAAVVGIWPGNGDGTFGPSINTNVASAGFIAIGDFNHDGLADLAVTQAGNSNTPAGITILLGKGDGTFQTPALYTLNYSPNTNIAVADFNGDGRDDLVVGGYSVNSAGNAGGYISAFLSNPDGTLQNPTTIPLAIGPSSLAVGDFNGDGHMDVACTSNIGAPYTLLGNGDGTLQSPVAVPAQLTGAIATGDFNRDGRTDLAGSFANTQAAGVEVLLGTAAPQGSAAVDDVPSDAGFQPAIEAGWWVMIKGSNLANNTRVWQASDLFEYISPTQINVQAPSDSATGAVNVSVTNNGHSSASATAQLQTVAPAFFMSPLYNVYVSVIPGCTPITAAAPAMPGDQAVLWATGFGPTSPATPAGTIVSDAPSTATLPVVTVGGYRFR